ncbi:MAG: transporter substrate-binding domain-containing protein [Microbacteriaceae bacterium]|nr:MAG: transporter substrate-binding domain-containing protein [Microbacteriaceae bacterium]
MKSKTRVRAVAGLITAVAEAVALVGCTPTSSGQTGAAGTQASELSQILNRGTIRVADCLSFAPFGFKNAQGNPDGYDVDIAKAIAQQLGVKLQMVDTTSANRIPNLQTNKVDLVICNFTRNGERAKQVAFTDPYVVASESLLVKQDSGINSINDLSGKTVATVKGSTDSDILQTHHANVKTQEYDTSQAAILAVKQGQASAMIEDSNFLAYQAKLDPSLKVTGDQLVPLEYNAMAVKQGDQIWLNWMNLFLFDYNASGQNATDYQKWFGIKPKYPLQPQY